MKRPALALAAALSLLAGCAQLPPTPGEAPRPRREAIDGFRLEGRITVRRGEENFSAGIDWRHDTASDQILVSGPLGQGLARLTSSPAGALLETAQRQRFEAADLDELSQRVFGARLPVSGMAHWVLGRPAAAGAARSDGAGRLSGLAEQGWTVEYLRYESEAAHALPVLLRAWGDGVDVRLIVDTWNLAP